MKTTKPYVLSYMPLYAGWMNQQVFKRLKLSHNTGMNIIDVGISDSLPEPILRTNRHPTTNDMEAWDQRGRLVCLTHFIKRMLPAEYCTKGVLTRRP
jgi:hypothetical protein